MLLLLVAPAFAGMYSQLSSATNPAVVWAGIDYSAAEIYVPETFADPDEKFYFEPGGGLRDQVRRFKDPKEAFESLTTDWNIMLQYVMFKEFEEVLQRNLIADLATPAGQTSRKGDDYFFSNYEAKNHPSTFTRDTVVGLVKKYKLKEKEGIGLSFIVERFSADDKSACIWPTWFDLKKKDVIDTEQVCEKPGGGEFRNRWLKPITSIAQDMVKDLKDESK